MYELLLFFGLVVIGYSINKSIETSVLVSLIITSLYAFFRKNNLKSEIREGMKSGSKKKKKKLGKDVSKFLKKRKFPKGKYNFDPKKTYIETYKSMEPTQMNGLKKDTKELISTQNKLMSTLKEMGPVLEQGKNIIGAFDSFFGDQKKTDLDTLLKHLDMNKKEKSK